MLKSWMLFGFVILTLVFPALSPWWITASDSQLSLANTFQIRLLQLLQTTTLLIFISGGVAISFGYTLAWQLHHANTPWQLWFWWQTLLAMLIPLPIQAIAWQVVFHSWLPTLLLVPGQVRWQPWNLGLLPAAWIHGIALAPWVAVFLLALLRSTDDRLRELAAFETTPFRRLRYFSWPIVRSGLGISMIWIGLVGLTEIPVTDAMMVRTLAEETYTQIVAGGGAEATGQILPWVMLLTVLGLLSRRSILQVVPIMSSRKGSSTTHAARPRWYWFRIVVIQGVLLLVLWLPILGLLGKITAGSWVTAEAGSRLWNQLNTTIISDGGVLIKSIGLAVVGAMLTVSLSRYICWCCWLAKWRIWSALLLFICIWLLLIPGPILSLGLAKTIDVLLDTEVALLAWLGIDLLNPPLRSLLYDQPSPVPLLWAWYVKYFPLACLFYWPVLQRIPRNLTELAQLEDRTGQVAWRNVLRPATQTMTVSLVFAMIGLNLAEVSVSRKVNPPFHDVYILRLFDMMHYGTEVNVASLAFIQVFALAIIVFLFLCWQKFHGFNKSNPQTLGETA